MKPVRVPVRVPAALPRRPDDSVPWLAIMSVWANVAGHFGSWQGARAEDAAGQ